MFQQVVSKVLFIFDRRINAGVAVGAVSRDANASARFGDSDAEKCGVGGTKYFKVPFYFQIYRINSAFSYDSTNGKKITSPQIYIEN